MTEGDRQSPSKTDRFILELDQAVYKAKGGDLERTMVRENAETFETSEDAEESLIIARLYRQFPNARALTTVIARWIEPDSSDPPAPGLYLTEEEYPDSIDRSVMLITSDDDEIFVHEIDVEGRCSWVEFAEWGRVDRYLSVPIEWPS